MKMNALNCLLITTSNSRPGDTPNKTGVWMEYLAAPYYVLRDAGEYITFASPKGGTISPDTNSQPVTLMTQDTQRFQRDAQAMYRFTHALPLKEVRAMDFDLVFVAGGANAMRDFPGNDELKHLMEDFIEQDKPVGLVGGAVVALLSLTKSNGEPYVKGRGVTAFTNREETRSGLDGKPPFFLESKLLSSGAYFSSGADFTSYVVVDENMITGQNLTSSGETATRLLERARTRKTNGQVRVKPAIL